MSIAHCCGTEACQAKLVLCCLAGKVAGTCGTANPVLVANWKHTAISAEQVGCFMCDVPRFNTLASQPATGNQEQSTDTWVRSLV